MYGYDDCNCSRCNNTDAPDEHEICECADYHDGGYHEQPEQWASDCQWCDDIVIEQAIEEAREAERERMDLQKGDQS